MAIDCGVYVYEQPTRINYCVAECFLDKLRWYLIEQLCQESKVWSVLPFLAIHLDTPLKFTRTYLYLCMHVFKRVFFFTHVHLSV